MNAYDGVKYGRIGFTGILNHDLASVWNDAPALFRKISSLRSVLAAKALSDRLYVSFSHCFTYNKIRYCAVFTPLYDRYYICRIYPEDFYLKNAFSEMYDYICAVRTRALSSLLDARDFAERNSEIFRDQRFDDYMESQIRSYEEICSDAGNVLKLFDKSHMCEYVPIEKYLLYTNDHLKKFNSDNRKNVLLDLDISSPVARINYTLFESAIFLMVRIFYTVMEENDSAVIKVSSRQDGSLALSSSYRMRSPLDERKVNKEIKLLRCSLSELGGELRFYVCGDRLDMKSYVPASLSNYVSRIRKIDRNNKNSSDMFELRGIDDIFDSYEKNFVAFRSPKEQTDADVSSMLAELILGNSAA